MASLWIRAQLGYVRLPRTESDNPRASVGNATHRRQHPDVLRREVRTILDRLARARTGDGADASVDARDVHVPPRPEHDHAHLLEHARIVLLWSARGGPHGLAAVHHAVSDQRGRWRV